MGSRRKIIKRRKRRVCWVSQVGLYSLLGFGLVSCSARISCLEV
jgi:hypothetical protein